MTAGAPTKYKPEELEHITQLCLLGATNDQLAACLGVNVDTIYEWKKVHPEFSEAIKQGGPMADAKVAQSLYKKAVGGDVAACIIWLKNRQPDKWREQATLKVEHEFTIQMQEAAKTLKEKMSAILTVTDESANGKPN